jgi:hypothetical protein
VYPPREDPRVKGVHSAIKGFLIALKDTVFLARSKWFYLVAEHAYVDALVKYLDSTWQEGKNVTNRFLKAQRKLLEVRFHVARIMEAPIAHRRAASSLNELYKYLVRTYAIESMLRDLRQKLQETMDIYEECLRIRILEKDRYEAEDKM